MAFFNRLGNMLRQTVINNKMSLASSPSIFQMLQCMSTFKVFVGGLGQATDDTNLQDAFSPYGEVSEARVITDRKTGKSKGFGFVTFVDYESAHDAIQAMDQWELHGQTVSVCFAKNRPQGGGGGYGGNNDESDDFAKRA